MPEIAKKKKRLLLASFFKVYGIRQHTAESCGGLTYIRSQGPERVMSGQGPTVSLKSMPSDLKSSLKISSLKCITPSKYQYSRAKPIKPRLPRFKLQ